MWDGLQKDLAEAGPADKSTRLHGEPEGTAGQLDYFKGSTFLRTIETTVGRARWDAYLRSYFDRHAFQPQTTAGFLADLRANLVRGDADLEKKLGLDRWAYGVGLPDKAVHVRSEALARVAADGKAFAAGGPAAAIDPARWSTQDGCVSSTACRDNRRPRVSPSWTGLSRFRARPIPISDRPG